MLTDILNCRIISHDFSIKTVTGIIGRDLTRSFFASGSITNFTTIEIGTRIGAIWFLPALFFASLILQLLLQKTEDDRILGISTAFIALVGHISGRFLWLPFSIQPGMFAVFFLWIGYEIRKYSLLEKLKWYHYVLAQICLILGIRFGYCYVSFTTAGAPDIILSTVIGLAGCLMIYLLSVINTK